MKCRVCRDRAVVEVRRHNAAFCRDHFLTHCREQVNRAIDKFHMLSRKDRVLVAVSGGKDSLMLWDVLLDFGYEADGLYIGLGIGAYSEESRAKCVEHAAVRGATLVEVGLPDAYGYDIPQGARAARRTPCSACGLSKRYVMNDAALRGGYDVLATGHNLDDEAAVLFGNLMHWNIEALRRQKPVLESAAGLVRKVKPLVRVAERETAAYAILRGIDYIVEECPMVAGSTGLRYKEALNEIESRSPGAKTALYFGFLDKGLACFGHPAAAEAADVHACATCGAPTTAEVCAFCRLRSQAADAEPQPEVLPGTRIERSLTG